MWIDAHCHLDAPSLHDPLPVVLSRAQDAQVVAMIAIGVGDQGAAIKEVTTLADTYSYIYFTAGIHPNDVSTTTENEWALVETALTHKKCVSLGEVGLDYHYGVEHKNAQIDLFERMIALGHTHQKPVMLHIRKAHHEAIPLLKKNKSLLKKPGVVHCFTEHKEIAAQYLDLGFYLSIPGVATFKNTEALAETIRYCPRDRLVIETDSPYLAPVPMRGKKNEPSFVPYVGQKIAELWQLSLEETAWITTRNAATLFDISVQQTPVI